MATYYATSDGLKTFKVDGDEVYEIEIILDSEQSPHHYGFCGLTDLTPSEVNTFDSVNAGHWNQVVDDVEEALRVGGRPSPFPPH